MCDGTSELQDLSHPHGGYGIFNLFGWGAVKALMLMARMAQELTAEVVDSVWEALLRHVSEIDSVPKVSVWEFWKLAASSI